MTRFGPLDMLGTIGSDHGYTDLLGHTVEIRVGGMLLRILNLESLIQVKEEVGHEKDRAVIPVLRRTLKEKLNRPE